VAVLEIDGAFSTPERNLYKFNPLAQMSSEEVWAYIRMLEIPYNSLHERGFISIGCEPCTRPVLPNQHEREGRWWWEESTQKECGLHAGDLTAKAQGGIRRGTEDSEAAFRPAPAFSLLPAFLSTSATPRPRTSLPSRPCSDTALPCPACRD